MKNYEVLDMKEVAALLKVSPATVGRLSRGYFNNNGRLQAYKTDFPSGFFIGRKRVFRRDVIERWIKEQEKKSA